MTLQETDWDGHYEQGDIPWDEGGAAPVLVGLLDDGVFSEGSSVLAPGCGMGHDVALLAEAGSLVTGLDISAMAVDAASKRYPVPHAKFEVGDLFDPEWAAGRVFDRVWEHTCFCAINPSQREDYVESMYRLLKPEGLFVGLFFTDTGVPFEEGPPFETSRDEVVELFSSRFTLVSEGLPSASYPSREGREWLMQWCRDRP